MFFTQAAVASCPQLYPFGKEIVVKNTTELCNSFYVVRYDEMNKRNIFSAEVLQPGGHTVERENTFRADLRVKNKVYPHDYSNTGYDRGHLVPAGDSTTLAQMNESFLMTNMAPQSPDLNRVKWRMLEEKTRHAAKVASYSIHVITGALYEGKVVKINGVPVPSGFYKVVFTNKNNYLAYYADNKNTANIIPVTIEAIENRAGYSLRK